MFRDLLALRAGSHRIRFNRPEVQEGPMQKPAMQKVSLIGAHAFICGLLVGIVLVVIVSACRRHQNRQNGNPQDDFEKVLNLASWGDYIAPDTVPIFEQETGIKVNYEIYDNNEVLEAKLMTGHTQYDVVIPTAGFFERQRKANIYQKLDKSALTNLGNADLDIMHLLAVDDPGNLYAVPYMHSLTGLGYNVEQVSARLGTQVPESCAHSPVWEVGRLTSSRAAMTSTANPSRKPSSAIASFRR
jgi:spermidine/putrescine-binding protein